MKGRGEVVKGCRCCTHETPHIQLLRAGALCAALPVSPSWLGETRRFRPSSGWRLPLLPGRGSARFLDEFMTRDQIQTAINEGIPFDIKMVDGAKYRVRQRYQVAVGRTSVVVFDDKDLAHILPLLTMTGITYLKPNSRR